jgi:transcriptional regulator with XRE-family HTH domain
MQVRDRKKIKRLMAVDDVSARQLAAGVGYASHSYVNRILAGTITTVTPERAQRIAKYLKVDVDDLFVGEVSTGTRRSAKKQTA